MQETITAWGTNDLHTSAQLVLAKRLGFFQQEGLQVQCKLFPSEEKFAQAFRKRSIPPFAWSQTVPGFLRLRAQGFPVKIIAPLAEISASYQMVLRGDAGIVLPGDLEGRKIGIVRGSLIEIAFRNMAKDFGLDLSRIHLRHAQPLEQLELFANAEIDALACWEPWTSQATYMGGTLYFSGLYSSIPGHEGQGNWLTGQSMLVSFEEHLYNAPDIMLALLKAIQRATNYLHNTVQKAASVFAVLLDTEPGELAQLIQKNLYSMKMNELFRIGLLSTLELFPSLEGRSPECSPQSEQGQRPHLETLYDTSVLAQLDPALVLQERGSAAPPDEKTIISEGEVYYPDDSRITHSATTALRYIIVDDTDVMVEMFSEIVKMAGGEVVGTASTGAEALVLYVDVLPDVVVIDISMPDMNGIEAIKNIFGMNPATNVIIMSGNNYEKIREELFALGVKLFIGKPFHVSPVVKAITQLTSDDQAGSETGEK